MSANEKIDDFIQEMHLKINSYDDIVFEWIPYSSQFNKIKEIGKGGFATIYTAIWKDGPLYYSNMYKNYARDYNQKVVLKYLHNSQNRIEFLIDEV